MLKTVPDSCGRSSGFLKRFQEVRLVWWKPLSPEVMRITRILEAGEDQEAEDCARPFLEVALAP